LIRVLIRLGGSDFRYAANGSEFIGIDCYMPAIKPNITDEEKNEEGTLSLGFLLTESCASRGTHL